MVIQSLLLLVLSFLCHIVTTNTTGTTVTAWTTVVVSKRRITSTRVTCTSTSTSFIRIHHLPKPKRLTLLYKKRKTTSSCIHPNTLVRLYSNNIKNNNQEIDVTGSTISISIANSINLPIPIPIPIPTTTESVVRNMNPFLIDENNNDDNIINPLLEYDHYNGITIHLSHYPKSKVNDIITNQNQQNQDQQNQDQQNQQQKQIQFFLKEALYEWKLQGKKGIWVHISKQFSYIIPFLITECHFDYHMVVANTNTNTNITTSTTTTTTTKQEQKQEQQQQQQHQQQQPPNSNNDLVISLWLPSVTIDKRQNNSDNIIITPIDLSTIDTTTESTNKAITVSEDVKTASSNTSTHDNNSNVISRLPKGPNHQIGVGIVLLHPFLLNTILVVQEQSGPAASYNLWKMPTGLLDTNEDIHNGAIRELYEETGIHAKFNGIVQLRQSHPISIPVQVPVVSTNTDTTTTAPDAASTTNTISTKADDTKSTTTKSKTKTRSISRKVSDLFIVCKMSLYDNDIEKLQQDNNTIIWTIDPIEILNIQWMSINDYCNQSVWQRSPTYTAMNNVIKYHTEQIQFIQHTVPIYWPNIKNRNTNTKNRNSNTNTNEITNDNPNESSTASTITQFTENNVTQQTNNRNNVPTTSFYQSSRM